MISFFAVDKVQLINTVINRVFHNCVGRIKLYVMDRVNMYFLGHGACPKWVRCLPNMGKRAAHFLTLLLSLPMIGMLVENNANLRSISAII